MRGIRNLTLAIIHREKQQTTDLVIALEDPVRYCQRFAPILTTQHYQDHREAVKNKHSIAHKGNRARVYRVRIAPASPVIGGGDGQVIIVEKKDIKRAERLIFDQFGHTEKKQIKKM